MDDEGVMDDEGQNQKSSCCARCRSNTNLLNVGIFLSYFLSAASVGSLVVIIPTCAEDQKSKYKIVLVSVFPHTIRTISPPSFCHIFSLINDNIY